MAPEEIIALLDQHRFRGMTEEDFQDAIETILTTSDITHIREERLTPRDRIDFMVGETGIEVKINGSSSEIIRQLGRYAAHERVTTLILASSRIRLIQGIPATIHGVPVHAVALRGGFL